MSIPTPPQQGNVAVCDSTNTFTLKVNSDGSINVQTAGSLKATYSATSLALASAASCTDLWTLTGSATKTVKVTRVEISGEATTAVPAQIVLLKRSVANLTGTSSAPTIVPYDSADGVASATPLAYTANPGTLGTAVGDIRIGYVFLSAPATATVGPEKFIVDFGSRQGQEVVLRGIAEVFAINLNAATVTGGAFDITVEWTEE